MDHALSTQKRCNSFEMQWTFCVCVDPPELFRIQVYLGLLEPEQCEVIRGMYLTAAKVLSEIKAGWLRTYVELL